jgi:hypothetical protein
MAANRKLPMNFYPPLGQSVTLPVYHSNQGNAVAPDHTLKPRDTYPHRLSKEIRISNRPLVWTQHGVQGTRTIVPHNTPTGKTFNNKLGSVPVGVEAYSRNRRMYIYNGKLVTE